MRIMAIDYGDARTGIAVSDISGMLVGDTWVIKQWEASSSHCRFFKNAVVTHKMP